MGGDDGKVVNMSDKSDDARLWTPERTLEDALEGLRSGKRAATKVLVVFLDDEGDKYDVGFVQAQMSSSQIVALVEVVKLLAIEEMGLLEG